MKAVFALLGALAIANAFTVTTPYYQGYYVYYDDAACTLSSLASIELYDSYTTTSTGTTCTTWGTGSYETLYVQGSPHNLGVMATQFLGICDAGSIRPFFDNYATSSSISTNRETIDVRTWLPGCHQSQSSSSYYDLVTVGTAGAGCSVDRTYCIEPTCNSTGCSSPSTYSLASTSSGCVPTTQQSDIFLDCATTPYTLPATKAELFYIDFTQQVWNLGDCGAGCPTYWLGDGVCDSVCANPGCDNDCNTVTGVCDCCIPNSQSTCCTPPAFSSYDVFGNECCTTSAETESNTANEYYTLIFEACICDGINSNLGLEAEVSLDANGVCNTAALSSQVDFSPNRTTTTTTVICDAAKVMSWCYAHAMQDSAYTTAAGTTSAVTQWITGKTETTTTEHSGVPVPACLGVGGYFVPDDTSVNNPYPTGSANWMCDAAKTLAGSGCDAVCGSASTFALSALLALFF